MKRLFSVLLFSVFLLAGAITGVSAEHGVDFQNDLIPVLTKHGCNAGACHGAAIGRGGFKLSLYGGDPKADYESIVRQLEGRRINLSQPQESLVLLKPSEQIEHGGGLVFDVDSRSAELLTNWIKQGASHESTRVLARVQITPQQHIASSLGEPIELRATAFYSDGTSRDVTDWTIFKAEDPSAVEVTNDLEESITVAKVLRRGRHIVVARYLSEVVPLELVMPMTDAKPDLAAVPRNNFIDDEILKTLGTLGLSVSPIVDDKTFLRRLTLDLTGRLPKTAGTLNVSATSSDGPSSDQTSDSILGVTGKLDREALIDELLQSDELNQYWTLQLAKLFRIHPQGDDSQGAHTYHTWLADQIARNVGYNELVRSLITATGDSHSNGPANFYRTVSGPREQAELMSELFMGSRLRCANCHNHPLDRWTQDDYHGLAAIFAKIESGKVVNVKLSGEVIHPRTLEPAVAKIPGEQFLSKAVTTDGRQQLADWLTQADNPYFAKAIVNRLWKRMLGRGLVEPTDDFRATNPATHPELLEKLAEDFVTSGYSLRHTLRVIASSAAYARSSDATEQNKDDDRFYSHASRRPLEPEVLADAISDVLGAAETYGNQPQGTRAVALVDPRTPSSTLDVLGRCGREESCESSIGEIGGLPQKLHLFNGALLNARISAKGSRLDQRLAARYQPLEIVDEFYAVALTRHPTAEESAFWQAELANAESHEKVKALLNDFVWGLMTCNEFVTNH